MFKAIIFDFDGVIVDSETKKFNDLVLVAQKYELLIKKTSFPEFIGKKRGFFLKQQFNELTDEKINTLMGEVRNLEQESFKEFSLIKGIKELLYFLQSKRVKLAITTGSKKAFVELILKAYKLTTFFDLIISGEQFDSSKPDPECYKITLDKLQMAPEECVVIEDSASGISAAKSVGIPVLGLTTYQNVKELKNADHQFTDHIQILSYLKSKL